MTTVSIFVTKIIKKKLKSTFEYKLKKMILKKGLAEIILWRIKGIPVQIGQMQAKKLTKIIHA